MKWTKLARKQRQAAVFDAPRWQRRRLRWLLPLLALLVGVAIWGQLDPHIERRVDSSGSVKYVSQCERAGAGIVGTVLAGFVALLAFGASAPLLTVGREQVVLERMGFLSGQGYGLTRRQVERKEALSLEVVGRQAVLTVKQGAPLVIGDEFEPFDEVLAALQRFMAR